jgi:Fe-S cluster biogenesis protein NfuA
MNTTPMIEVYTEYTPNPESLKFVANRMLLMDTSADFRDAESAKRSPMAEELFRMPFVKGVFITANFVTITKSADFEWLEVVPQVREFLKTYIAAGYDVLLPQADTPATNATETAAATEGSVEDKIINILNTYVRPAVENDGGNIQFKSFKDGQVTLILQGSCSGCPSSTYTLKAGIEGLLQKMVPEVKEVVAEAEAEAV